MRGWLRFKFGQRGLRLDGNDKLEGGAVID